MVFGVILGMVAGVNAASSDSANINLLISPIVMVDLSVSTNTYNFGLIELAKSTGSLTAITLTNTGNVGFKVSKVIWTDGDGADWDITKSSTETNGFDLWAMVNVGKPSLNDFVSASAKFNESGLGAAYLNALNDNLGAQVDMSPEQTKDLWFRIDMPKQVTKEAQQIINVRLKATAN